MKNTTLDAKGQTVGMFFHEVPPTASFPNPLDKQMLAIKQQYY